MSNIKGPLLLKGGSLRSIFYIYNLKYMQVVILAAGRGVRMGDLTEQIPKPMLKIGDKPILDHKISALPREVKEVVLIVSYKKEIIQNYFGSEFDGRRIVYVEQKDLNGTGGALLSARDKLKAKFLVMMGDDLYTGSDVSNIMMHDLAVLGYYTENPNQYGVLEVDVNGNWINIIEKPKHLKSGLVNTGLYMLTQDFFNYPLVDLGNGEFGLPQTMLNMADDFNIKIVETNKWFPIGNPQALEEAEQLINDFS